MNFRCKSLETSVIAQRLNQGLLERTSTDWSLENSSIRMLTYALSRWQLSRASDHIHPFTTVSPCKSNTLLNRLSSLQSKISHGRSLPPFPITDEITQPHRFTMPPHPPSKPTLLTFPSEILLLIVSRLDFPFTHKVVARSLPISHP